MEWKDIKGYEGYYKCNENGEILNVKRNTLVKPYKSIGHYAVGLCVNHKRKCIYVHRIIYETFVGEIPKGGMICHIDCDASNNKLSNLKLYKSIKDRYNDSQAKKIITRKIEYRKPQYADDIEGEIWVDLIGTEGRYKISNLGRIKNIKSNRLLYPYVKRNRYRWIHILNSKCNIHASLHRLIYESFNGKIKEGNQVDHINGNSFDDRLENLREVTPQENKENPNSLNKINDRRKIALENMGGKTGTIILKIDLQNNILETYKTLKECAKINKHAETTISKWINGTSQQDKNLKKGFVFMKEFDYYHNKLSNQIPQIMLE